MSLEMERSPITEYEMDRLIGFDINNGDPDNMNIKLPRDGVFRLDEWKRRIDVCVNNKLCYSVPLHAITTFYWKQEEC